MKQQSMLIGALTVGSMFLMVTCLYHYYWLDVQLQKVRHLQEQYYECLTMIQRHTGHRPLTSTVLKEVPSVNRSFAYLEQSVLSFLDSQSSKDLVAEVETESVLENSVDDAAHESVIPSWAQPAHRVTETNISFISPLDVSKFWLSSLFGSRKKPNGQVAFHQGIDMAAQRGTDVYAAAEGIIEYAGYALGYGNTIVVIHDAVYKTRYAHLDEIHVVKDQRVTQGMVIGAVGDTGFTMKQGHDASHLHFELYERGKQVNPLVFISV